MLVKCSWCQKTFNSDRYGRQYCSHCGAELDVPVPAGREAAPEAKILHPGEQEQAAAPRAPAPEPRHEGAYDPWAQPGEPGAVPPAGGVGTQGPYVGQAGADGGQWGAPYAGQPGAGGGPWGGGGGALPPGGWGGPFGGDGPPQDEPAPWDRRSEIGTWPALVETWKQATLDPKRFFARLSPTGLGEAFLYGWILSTVGMLIGSLTSVPLLGLFGIESDGAWAELVGAPVLAALGIFIQAGLLHLMCMLLGCATRGFDGTFRVVAYAQGPALISIVPGIGGLVSMVWTAVLTIHGIAAMHRTTTGKATLAVMLPGLVLITCCGCGAGLAVMAGMHAMGGSGITTF